MRIAAALAVASVTIVPAHASTGLACEGVDSDVAVGVVLGAGLIRTPVAASLRDVRGERRTVGPGQAPATALVIGQSWLDGSEFRLDLLDVDARSYEARLRVRFLREGPTLAVGTLVIGDGQVVEVECREG